MAGEENSNGAIVTDAPDAAESGGGEGVELLNEQQSTKLDVGSRGDDQRSEDDGSDQPVSPRDQAIAAIVANRREQIEAESLSGSIDDGHGQADDDGDGEGDAIPLPKSVKIKVDGVEQEAPVDHVLEVGKRALQKDISADRRLREAHEEKLAAERRILEARKVYEGLQRKQEELRERERRLAEMTGTGHTQNVDNDQSIEEESREFGQALVEDEEKAAEIYRRNIERTRALEQRIAELHNNLVATQENVQAANSVLTRQQKVEFANVQQEYADKFQDVATNDDLHQRAMAIGQQIRMQDPSKPEIQVMREAAEQTREWARRIAEQVGMVSGGHDAENQQPVDQATENKRRMVKHPARAGGRTSGKPQKQRKSPAEIISDMRAARGLPA